MRILQVVSLITADGAFGGPARVATNQSAALARLGHRVTLAAGGSGRSSSPPEHSGFRLELFEARTLLPGSGFPGMVVPGLVNFAMSHAGEFDVAHIHFGRDLMVLPASAALRLRHLPYVLQTHGMVIPSRHPLAPLFDAACTRRLLAGAEAVLYLTDRERAQLCDVARTEPRLVQLPNGVPDYPPAERRPGPPEVLFVARLDARKRPGLFVAMAKTLLRQGYDAAFTMVGPDEGEGPAVRAAITGEPRITWEGPLDPRLMPTRLTRAAVLVLPSEREPYPMAVLEAMAVGIPVVVCDDCGLAPMIRRTRSGVVVPGTVEHLAAGVREVLSDRTGFGMRARETARREFRMDAVAERLAGIYQRIGTRR